jgi:hypothetical protein
VVTWPGDIETVTHSAPFHGPIVQWVSPKVLRRGAGGTGCGLQGGDLLPMAGGVSNRSGDLDARGCRAAPWPSLARR